MSTDSSRRCLSLKTGRGHLTISQTGGEFVHRASGRHLIQGFPIKWYPSGHEKFHTLPMLFDVLVIILTPSSIKVSGHFTSDSKS